MREASVGGFAAYSFFVEEQIRGQKGESSLFLQFFPGFLSGQISGQSFNFNHRQWEQFPLVLWILLVPVWIRASTETIVRDGVHLFRHQSSFWWRDLRSSIQFSLIFCGLIRFQPKVVYSFVKFPFWLKFQSEFLNFHFYVNA